MKYYTSIEQYVMCIKNIVSDFLIKINLSYFTQRFQNKDFFFITASISHCIMGTEFIGVHFPQSF